MTRKDYNIIAASLLLTRPSLEDPFLRRAQWNICVEALISQLGDANPRFKESRFADACHYPVPTTKVKEG